MAEEEGSVTMTELAPTQSEIVEDATQASGVATVESVAEGGTESTYNNKGEASCVCEDGNREKTVEFSDELLDRGKDALKEKDYSEAAECFSRALEIRVAHYGELAPECLNAYYQYGRALLYKAQEETDPLASMAKKGAQQGSDKVGSIKNAMNGESSSASFSVSSNIDQEGGSNNLEGAGNEGTITVSGEQAKDEDNEGSEDEDLAEAEEDESDLDLAWKMLDVARAISEKHSGDQMQKVDILSTLAEVSLEREDIETSLSDYQKALSILEQLVEPDSRHLAELNFRICLCLEIGSMTEEAISYCQKAISICKSRVQRLMNEVKGLSETAASFGDSELDNVVQHCQGGSQNDKLLADKEAEIVTLTGLSGELEKKLEDLQQMALNPKKILAEILGMTSAEVKGIEKGASSTVLSSSQMGAANSNVDFDSPTVSTAHTNGAAGVTRLGVVGRGVKRVSMSTDSGESSAMKKPTLDVPSDKGDGDIN